jgi:hypothetical protein
MGKLTAPPVGVPVLSSAGSQLSWTTISGAKKYVVYVLEKDSKINNSFNAHAIQINSDQKYTGNSGMSYFVTALNDDQLESARSAILTIK